MIDDQLRHLDTRDMPPRRVLAIAGSLRRRSYNRSLIDAAVELAPPGLTIEIFPSLRDIPLYDADVEERGDPEPVTAFKQAISAAEALLIATPEYNYGVPGVLKNAVDWASRPPGKSCLNRKPAAIMGATPGGTGTARAQLALRQSFVFTETWAMLRPEVLVSRAHEKIDGDGKVTDEATRKAIAGLLAAFADWIERFAGPRAG
jgi:chromate reductase, NAD(P)H dehydrogenase (quinone)